MTRAEQILSWKGKRADLLKAANAIMEKAALDADGRTLTEEEQKEFDALQAKVKQIDQQVSNLEAMERADAAQATPVVAAAAANQQNVDSTRGAPTVLRGRKDADDKFEGQAFTRLTIAKMLRQIDGTPMVQTAQKRGWHKTNPTVFEIIKANEIPSITSDGEYGSELVDADTRYTGDFIEYLWGDTVYDRLGLRDVPANTRIKGQEGASSAYWVGESKAIPLTIQDFNSIDLVDMKIATIAVCANEWLRDSTPSGERLVRDSLVSAARRRADETFLSTSALVSNVSPAGIFNGVTALGSSGEAAADVRSDIGELLRPFVLAKNASNLTFVMSKLLAVQLSLMVNSLSSQREFPGLGMEGGELNGIKVVTGDNVPLDWFALVKPSDIWRIGAGGIEVSMSRDASLEMRSAPLMNADSPTEASLVSMFQTESTAIKVVMPMNFQKRRSHAAQFISDAHYGQIDGTVTA